MPLSEDEQRILQDIERSFYETDPKFAETVSHSTLFRHASRNCKLAAVGFVLSLAVLLASFIRFPIVGFLGFVGMLVCTVFFVQNVRRLGASGLRDAAAASDRAQQMGQSFDGFRSRFKRRFKDE